MKRTLLVITDELDAAIRHATTNRNAATEDWLWRIKEVREAAKELGLTRKPRAKVGRPKK